jgi:hypothetical protein
MAANMSALNAPVPGMSLTTEPGNRPWETPPSMSTVEEAIEFYTQRILGNEDAHDDLLEVMEAGIPIRNLANIINKASVMEGKHTLDVGFLVLPVIEELLMAVADTYGARYITSVEDMAKEKLVSPRQARLAMEELNKSKAVESETGEDMEVPMSKGLMARPMGEE